MEDIQPIQTEPQEDDRVPLWKQILGAVIGGGLALALYYGYEYAKPKVEAYLTLPPAEDGRMYNVGDSNIADKTTDEGNRKRILSRNIRVGQQLEQNADPSRLAAVDTHETDIAWPGHDESDPKYAEVMGLEEDAEDSEDAEDTMQPESGLSGSDSEDEWDLNESDWNMLWDELRTQEMAEEQVEKSNADDLPDTGFGLGFLLAGAAGGTLGARRKQRKKKM